MAAVSPGQAVLHYVYDPLCGWCYAVAPLILAARALPGLQVRFHAGGMMTGPNRRRITPEWRGYVLPHDRRIAQLSGQPFGPGYTDGLLRDTEAWLDSGPPITATLAAQALAGAGLDMLHALQQAHYETGRRIAEPAVLAEVAATLGMGRAGFEATYAELAGEATAQHIAQSRALLAQLGGQGFPTLALAPAEPGPAQRLEASAWLGRPAEFAAHLQVLSQAGLRSSH